MDDNARPNFSVRASTAGDLDWAYERLVEAIDTSPYYNDSFKAWEKARLNRNFVDDLFAHDPWHIFIGEADGERASVQFSGPDCGVLFLYWSYVSFPYRNSGIAQFSLRRWAEHFDHGDYHKAVTYTKPDNRAANILMKRFGWQLVAELQQHIFGENYLMFDLPFDKVNPGYVTLKQPGRLGRMARRVKALVAR